MELFQIIEEIIGARYRINPVNNLYELCEENEIDYPITRIKTSGPILVYKFDKKGKLFPFFSQSKEFINKTSDYLIYNYNTTNKQLYIFVIELKSNNHNSAYKQLYASNEFVNYINSMASAYSKIIRNQIIKSDQVIIRHIIISKKSQKFATNVSNVSKYHKHVDYHFEYLHWQAGKSLNLTSVY